MTEVMDKWMSHPTMARFALASPVVVTHKSALTRDAFDLMKTLVGGTPISVEGCVELFQEMHDRKMTRRKLYPMLHEEEYLRSAHRAHSSIKRKKFSYSDLDMTPPLTSPFCLEISRTLESDEEYSLLFNEQVSLFFVCDSVIACVLSIPVSPLDVCVRVFA